MSVITGFANGVKNAWKRSMLGKAMVVAPPVALIVLVAFWQFGGEPVQYYTAKVEKGDVSQEVASTGTINAVTTVQVGSQVSGNLSEIMVDFNSQVKKGQVIAQLDPSILRARLLQAEADLENARANVKNSEAQIETAKADVLAAVASVDRARAQNKEAQLNLKRTLDLFEQGIFSASQRDTAQANADSSAAALKVAEAQAEQSRTRLKSIQANLEQAKAQVSQRKAAAELARVDLGHTTITAPIDGTVVARNVDVGQTVAASLSAPTLFIIAQDLTKMLVYAKTDEADVGKIKVGATATFRVDSFPREQFTGKVIQVRMNATTVQNVVTYDTIIEFDNPQKKLFPGMTAYVRIPVAWANDVVKVPNGALRFRPDMTEDEIKKVYEKYKIPYMAPGQRRPGGQGTGGSLAASGGGQQAGAGGQAGGAGAAAGGEGSGRRTGGGGGNRGGESAQAGGAPGGGGQSGGNGERRAGGNMGGGMAGVANPFGVVWKLVDKKELVPVRVRLGVTDFTFTELRGDELKPGDELIIGMSGGKSGSGTTAGQQNRPPGMGSPMGGPGGMRRM